MNTTKLIVIFILVFLVGTLAGSLGTRIYLRHELSQAQAHKQDPEDKIKRVVARLTDGLKLDSTQEGEVRRIITATEARATGVKALWAPELKKVYDLSFQRIGEKLTGPQKANLEKRQERFTTRYNAMYFKSLRAAQAGVPGIGVLARNLGLNESQKVRVASVLEDLKKQENLTIGKYEKMDRPDLMAVRENITGERLTAIKNLTTVLTREQLERFKTECAY